MMADNASSVLCVKLLNDYCQEETPSLKNYSELYLREYFLINYLLNLTINKLSGVTYNMIIFSKLLLWYY